MPALRPSPYRARLALTIPLVAAAATVAILFGLAGGTLDTSLAEALRVLTGASQEAPHRLAVLEVRLPRLVCAAGAGAALAASGTILQAVARNPLADPGVLGVNAGASLAVVGLIVAFGAPSTLVIAAAAFAGAFASAALVLALARAGGTSPARLVLTGIAIGACASSAASFLMVAGGVEDVQRAMVWLAGSLHGRGWTEAAAVWATLAVLAPATMLAARRLDALMLDDVSAHGLGAAPAASRLAATALAALLAGASVAAAGALSFIGLAAPHLARKAVGPIHHRLLPVAMAVGATLTMAADVIGRLAVAPIEIPAGIVTAALGAPLLVWVLRRTAHV